MAFVLYTFPIKASQRGWPSKALGAGIIPVPERGGEARKGEARCNFDPVRLAGVTNLLVRKGPVIKGLVTHLRPCFLSLLSGKVLERHG